MWGYHVGLVVAKTSIIGYIRNNLKIVKFGEMKFSLELEFYNRGGEKEKFAVEYINNDIKLTPEPSIKIAEEVDVFIRNELAGSHCDFQEEKLDWHFKTKYFDIDKDELRKLLLSRGCSLEDIENNFGDERYIRKLNLS